MARLLKSRQVIRPAAGAAVEGVLSALEKSQKRNNRGGVRSRARKKEPAQRLLVTGIRRGI